MSKQYKSVSDMVNHLVDDKDFNKEFEREAADRKLANTLFTMRCAKGLTQKEMAAKLGCTQGRVSKLEHAGVDSIKVSDVVAYAQALDLQTSIQFYEERNAVQSVKYHAFQIKTHLDHLAKLAHRDDEIFEGVKTFYWEYLQNILMLFKSSADKFPKRSKKKQPALEVVAPTDTIEETLPPVEEKLPVTPKR